MTKEDFLQIFKSGFHKLNLVGIKRLRDERNEEGRTYGVYLGKFEFVPPEQVWGDDAIDYDFLWKLLKEFDEELSNCIARKFTRKIYKNGSMVKKCVFRYTFDIVPKNVVSFKFDRSTKTMSVVVLGYGMKK